MTEDNDSSISKFSLFLNSIKKTYGKFSITEKVIFFVFLLVLVGSTISSLTKVNAKYLVEVPQRGGTIEEGLIGTPRFINPVIAISDTDRDISSLVYSGLLKINSDGEITEDLAESYSISEDGLIYNVKIRDDAFFHDGEAVTVDDLIFTIKQTQDPKIKSPKRPNWDGVLIEKINDKEIEFILSQPYSPFIYNLTLGILPQHIWENISSDEFAFSKYNLEPIGSGPFVVKKVNTNSDGIIEKYKLEAYKNYTLGEPYIQNIDFTFYKNENELRQAIEKGSVTSGHSLSPKIVSEINLKNNVLMTSTFSRTFALYFNKTESDILKDETIREVLNSFTPKDLVVDQILASYGNTIESPAPAELSSIESSISKISAEEARLKLEEAGWEIGEDGIYIKENDDSITRFSFSVSTANVSELVEVTEFLANEYRKIGAEINVKIFEPNDLTLNVIRPRDFESILFGQVVNRDLDLYAFWHSSQRNDPGLNIAGFTNIDADGALEKLRATFDKDEQKEALQIFEKEVINDLPAIFLYSPNFIYIVSDKLNLEVPKNIVTSSDRFADIEKWYMETDLVWEIFAN